MEKTSGEAAGSIELLAEPWAETQEQARRFAEQQFAENGRQFSVELPHFDAGLEHARSLAKQGKYHRHEMPVIEEPDLPDLRAFIEALGGKVSIGMIAVHDLRPTQCQLYIDRSVKSTARNGRMGTEKFLKTRHLATDIKGDILDGHHRWLSGSTISTRLTLPQFKIELPLSEMLPDLLRFSDARHDRNA